MKKLFFAGLISFALGIAGACFLAPSDKEGTTISETAYANSDGSVNVGNKDLLDSKRRGNSPRTQVRNWEETEEIYLKLIGTPKIEELRRFFDELSEDPYDYDYLFTPFVLQKWGEFAPRQGMELIMDRKDFSPVGTSHHFWALEVFVGWIRKNPEEAAAYFKESDNKIKNNIANYYFITRDWAELDPVKMLEWTKTLGNNRHYNALSGHAQSMAINAVLRDKPEQLKKLLPLLDEKTKEYYSVEFDKALGRPDEGN